MTIYNSLTALPIDYFDGAGHLSIESGEHLRTLINKFVANANAIAATGTADTIALRDSNGDLIVAATPTSANAAAPKAWVQALVSSMTYALDSKDSVKAATTANITLSGPQTVDTVSIIAGDRVLVKDQTAPAENGIYLCAAGAWTRAPDMAAGADAAGSYCQVEQGSGVNQDKFFACTNNKGLAVVGTDALVFADWSTIITHNSALSIQGGSATERYHLTQAQHDTLTNGSDASSLHIHDSIYFTETEHIASSAGVGDAGKPIKLDAAGVLDVTFFDLTDWDSRFFTEAEHIATSAGVGDAGKPIKLDAAGVLDVTFFDLTDWDSRFFTEAEHIASSAGVGDAGKPVKLDAVGVLDVTFFDLTDWDSRYYTETELDAGQLDTRYFTETEHIATSAGVGDAGKPIKLDAAGVLDVTFFDLTDWDSRYYTETELDAGQLDTRYFTETEHIASSAGGADAGKPIKLDGAGVLDITFFDMTDWDTRYYTEAEHIATSAGAADAGKPIKLDAGGCVDSSMINDADIDHGTVTGLGDDDHTQYHNDARGDVRYYTQASFIATSAGAADAGKPIKLDAGGLIDSSMIDDSDIDHGTVTGLGDDDHTQYHNDARGDARYYTQASFINVSAGAGDAGKPVVLDAGGCIDATMINDADVAHNSTASLQGGTGGEYYHLTSAQHSIQILQIAKVSLAAAAPAAGDFAGLSNDEWCFAEGSGGVIYILYKDDGGNYQFTGTVV